MKRALLAIAVISACARPNGPALPKQALAVPLVRQSTNYTCGAAALLAVLYYWQVFDGREGDVAEALKTTPDNGAPPPRIVALAKSFGLQASVKQQLDVKALRAALAGGATAIIPLQAYADKSKPTFTWRNTWEDGHYVVLIGLDDRYAYFMDPSSAAAYGYIPLDEFVERWHDYEVVTTGKPLRYLQSAILIRGTRPLKQVPAPLVRME